MMWPVIAMVQFAVIIVLWVIPDRFDLNWAAIGAVATAGAAGVALWLGWREGTWRRTERAAEVRAAKLWLQINLHKIQRARDALTPYAFMAILRVSGRPSAQGILSASADCFEEFATNSMTLIADQVAVERLASTASSARALADELNNQMSAKIATYADVQREIEALFEGLPKVIGGKAL